MVYVQLLAGLLLLFGGGDFLVRGAVAVAKRLGVSPLVIGLTLVGFGTSTPELVASIKATLNDAPAIAVGNVVGSNLANILLILGVASIITPLTCARTALMRDGGILLLVSLLLLPFAFSGELGRLAGIVFLCLLVAYTLGSYYFDRRSRDSAAALHEAEAESVDPVSGSLWKALLITFVGIAGVLYGASLLVDSAIDLAAEFGISQAVIGLSVVAIGTSLPELAAAIMAAIRRHTDIAFGNVVGSNIFNILGILGTTAIVKPLAVPQEMLDFDLWAMLAATLLLLVAAFSGRRLIRGEGAFFLACYAGYLWLLFSPQARAVAGLE
jgi:cation:H+ antiporter